MKRFAMILTVILMPVPALAQDVSGKWDVTVNTPNGQNQAVLMLKKDGEKLSGTIARPNRDPIPVSGTQKAADVVFSFTVVTENGNVAVTMTGRQDGESMKGTAEFGDRGQGDWTAARTAASSPKADAATAVDMTGTWQFQVTTEAGSGSPTVTLKQEGDKLSGRYSGMFGEAPLAGEIKDTAFTFSVTMTIEGNPVTLTYSGKVEQTSVSGRVVFGSLAEGTFTGKKLVAGGK